MVVKDHEPEAGPAQVIARREPGLAAADDDDATTDRQLAQVIGLTKIGDVIDGIDDATHIFAFEMQFVGSALTEAEKDSVKFLTQIIQL